MHLFLGNLARRRRRRRKGPEMFLRKTSKDIAIMSLRGYVVWLIFLLFTRENECLVDVSGDEED